MGELFLIGVKLAMAEVSSDPASSLAAALQELGPAPGRTAPSESRGPKDPKDPDDSQTRSSMGPFSGDNMTALGLNATQHDYSAY